MISFRPMHPAEFDVYRTLFVREYTLDLIANHHMPPEAARQKAAKDLDDTFPDGQGSPGHHLLSILSEEGGHIGYLCYESQSEGQTAYVLDFEIMPEFRGQGLAKAAIAALNLRAKDEGFAQIKLRVAPDNDVAQHVYAACGFHVSGIQMVKPL